MSKRILSTSEEERFSILKDDEKKLVLKFEEKFSSYEAPSSDPGFVLDYHTYIRFLTARKWDFDASLKLFEQWMQWRLDVKPHLIVPKDIPNELKCEKAYWHGYDKEGCPIIVVKIYNHDGSVRDFQECLKFALYTAEYGIRLTQKQKNHVEQYVILYDARSIGWNNFDLEMCREFYKCTEMYPETLKRMLVIKPGWMFSVLFGVIKQVVDQRTSDKAILIHKFEDLHQYIDPDQIQEEFGGKSKFKYVPPTE